MNLQTHLKKHNAIYKFMIKILIIVSSCFFISSSCNSQKIEPCAQKLKVVNDLIFYHPNVENPAYDSALILINDLKSCDDSIRTKVVKIKFMILLAQERFDEGADWVSALAKNEFPFPFQKESWYDYYQAADFENHNNIKSRDSIYAISALKLRSYEKQKKLVDPEFNEFFRELLQIESIILNKDSLNDELDVYISLYPQKRDYFEFWRK